MAPASETAFNNLKKRVADLEAMSSSPITHAWVQRHPTGIWVIGIGLTILTIVVTVFVGVIPHLDKDADQAIQNKVTTALQEPLAKIGRMAEDIAQIKGSLEILRPVMSERLAQKMKASASLNSHELASSVHQISASIAAAKNAKVTIDPSLIVDVGKRVLSLAADEASGPSIWKDVVDFLNYRSFLNVDLGPPNAGTVQNFVPKTFYAWMENRSENVQLSNSGNVPRSQAAILEPLGANLNGNNPIGDRLLILEGKEGRGTMTLDGLHIKNVIFRNLRVKYFGGRIRIENAQFINCEFQVVRSATGSLFANAILDSPSTKFATA